LAESLARQTSLALANLRLRETLFHQAVRDPLTNLFNRRYLEETLVRELARSRRQGIALGVIMIDLDNFKGFNDAFGHAVGDALLSSLARLLERHIRREDIACRFGGEEFTIILPGASLEVARQRAEQLREAISGLHVEDLNQSPVAVTASLGVAAFPDHGETDSEVLWAADAALLTAKAQGRNRVVVATPDGQNSTTGGERKRLLA
jgi:diguanylate cyclase (GGDEF)-like protein